MLRRLNKLISRRYRHIMDLDEEKAKYDLEKQHDGQVIQKYSRVHKPSYELELNRVGEILLYSASPFKHKTVFFKYPYVFFESLIPLCLFNFFLNPLCIDYNTLQMSLLSIIALGYPRVWHLEHFSNYVRKISLLRGGKVLKVERNSLAGDHFIHWIEIKDIHPLTKDFKDFDDREEAEFLNKEGQLKYELAIQNDHQRTQGITQQDKNLFFVEEGTVHEPELFEAAIKGYHVDTSNFTINTAHDERVREGHYSIQFKIIYKLHLLIKYFSSNQILRPVLRLFLLKIRIDPGINKNK